MLLEIQEVQKKYALSVHAIIKLEDLIVYLEQQAEDKETLDRVEAYRQRYGIKPQ